mmetsp:Transcript_26376/g.32916  ORF Transcript_26376/g.32916 Transcript_26376/m.32916 type:complete len:93 (+) Transcript_26376:304-582(+)
MFVKQAPDEEESHSRISQSRQTSRSRQINADSIPAFINIQGSRMNTRNHVVSNSSESLPHFAREDKHRVSGFSNLPVGGHQRNNSDLHGKIL